MVYLQRGIRTLPFKFLDLGPITRWAYPYPSFSKIASQKMQEAFVGVALRA